MKYFVTADRHVRSSMGKIARNAESRTIKRLRIQSWFQAVSHASGLSAGELEYQFSLANEQCPRSCIWDKYRRGDVAPRDGLIKAVEDRYPGTAQWLHSPLWRFADEIPMDMAEIRSAYERLPSLLRSMFVVRQATESTVFWRRPVETSEACDILLRINSIDALIATLLLVKEAETAQIQDQHMEGIHFALSYLARFTRHPAIGGAINSDLQIYLKSRWANLVYPEIPEDNYDAQTGDNSHLYPDTGAIAEPSSMR